MDAGCRCPGHGCQGNQGSLPCDLIFPETEREDMTRILEFIYCGQVNVSEEQLVGFFEIAKMLGVKGLVDSCHGDSVLVKAMGIFQEQLIEQQQEKMQGN